MVLNDWTQLLHPARPRNSGKGRGILTPQPPAVALGTASTFVYKQPAPWVPGVSPNIHKARGPLGHLSPYS